MDSEPGRRLTGIGFALLSATGFGVMPVLTKVVYEDGTEPVAVLAIRFALAAPVLLLLARPQPLAVGFVVITTVAVLARTGGRRTVDEEAVPA